MDMIDKVAAAIMSAQAHGENLGGQARAAIEAMREPTEAMLKAGAAADWVGEVESREGRSIMPSEGWDGTPRPGIWTAMIDAAIGQNFGEAAQHER